jgi:hypothetical protein
MSSIARWLARITWFWIIQWMRKPWMRRAHLAPLRWMKTEDRKEKFLDSYRKQNRLARRIGIPMLKTVYFIFLACMALQITYSVAMTMNEKGWLSPPQLDSHRINQPTE